VRSIRGWRSTSQSIAANNSASETSPSDSSSPSVVCEKRRVADSFEPGPISRWQIIATTRSRSRQRSRLISRSTSRSRSTPSTAAT